MLGGNAPLGGPRRVPGGPLTVADLLAGAQRVAAATAATPPLTGESEALFLPASTPAAAAAATAAAATAAAASTAAAATAAEGDEFGSFLALTAFDPQGAPQGAPGGPPKGDPTRRLMIDRVVLENFKSYNKKRVIGPFHKRFTAIVGPNGSGKSNVIDAMLFVFGRRAQQIRLRKVTELIHNSAAVATTAAAAAAAAADKRPRKKLAASDKPTASAAAAAGDEEEPAPIDRASVSVFFQEIIDRDPESDDYEVIPGSCFVVSREVSRHSGGTTSFAINGRKCLQKEVVSLLKSKGLDLQNNRFLILQGEVEQIALMKPKAARPEETGLLEYLEDLIGTSRFIEPIQQAQEQFDGLCQLYQEKANRMRCASAELRRLKGPKDEALVSLKTNRDAAAARVILAALHKKKRQKEAHETGQKLAAAEKTQKEAEAKAEELQKALQTIEEEAATEMATLKDYEEDFAKADSCLQKLIWRDEELRAELGGEVSRLEEKQEQLQQTEKRQQQQKQQLQQLEVSLQERNAEKEAENIKRAEEAVEKAKETVAQYQESIKEEVKKLSEKHAAAEKVLLQQQQQLDKQQTAAAKTTTALEMLERKERQLRERQQQAHAALKRCSEGDTANAAALQQQQQLQTAAAKELLSLTQQKTETEKAVSQLEQELLTAKSQLRRVEQQRQETRCSGKLVALLSQEKRDGRLQGLLDRLGNLGSIPKKYERAFLAASGGFCGFFVVEGPPDASELFALLRKHELGRSNALALRVLESDLGQRMQEADAEAARWTYTGAPRLLDLLQFATPRVRIAFFKAVGSTRVAKDMEEAMHIAYSLKQRVVTLDGGLIELDGRMVGGGLGFGSCSIRTDGLEGRAPLAVSADGDNEQQQLQKLQQTIKQIQTKLSEAKQKREQLGETEKHLQRQRAEAEAAIEMLQQDIASAKLQRRELERTVKAAEAESLSSSDREKLKELRASAATAGAAQNELHQRVKAQETVVSKLLDDLQNAGGEEMKKRKAKLLHAERAFNRLKEETGRREADVAAKRAEALRLSRDKERLEREIATHTKRSAEIRDDLSALEVEAKDIITRKEEAAEKVQTLKAQVSLLQKRQQEAQESLKASSLASLETQHLFDSLQQQLQQHQQQAQHQQQQLAAALQRLMEIDATITAEEQEDSEQQQQQQQHEQQQPLALTEDSKQQQQQQQQQQQGDELEPEQAAVLQRLSLDISDVALEGYTAEDVAQLQQQQKQQQQTSLHAFQLYAQKRQELRKKETEAREAATLREETKAQLKTYQDLRKSEFLTAFSFIAAKLKETYRMLSQGGDAELELGDASDPFSEGIILSVRPPKKSWRQIQNLSGGERTLSSLSLVFALHHYKPTCIYFLDEIDAALDHRNVAILGAFVLQKARDAQFIIISLRNQLFELANRLVGIYKTFDATKSVSLDPSRLAAEEDEKNKGSFTATQQKQLPLDATLALPAAPLLPALPAV